MKAVRMSLIAIPQWVMIYVGQECPLCIWGTGRRDTAAPCVVLIHSGDDTASAARAKVTDEMEYVSYTRNPRQNSNRR